jgi:hypothetical protein
LIAIWFSYTFKKKHIVTNKLSNNQFLLYKKENCKFSNLTKLKEKNPFERNSICYITFDFPRCCHIWLVVDGITMYNFCLPGLNIVWTKLYDGVRDGQDFIPNIISLWVERVFKLTTHKGLQVTLTSMDIILCEPSSHIGTRVG